MGFEVYAMQCINEGALYIQYSYNDCVGCNNDHEDEKDDRLCIQLYRRRSKPKPKQQPTPTDEPPPLVHYILILPRKPKLQLR